MTTKEHILDIATDAFSAKGFSGVRIDELAKDAGVNKATLYYHYKSKQEIFDQVMHRQFLLLYQELQKSTQLCEGSEAQLAAFIDTFFNRKIRDVALIVREIIDGGTNLSESFLQTMEQIREILSRILKKGKEEGVFLGGDLHEVMGLIIGISDFHILGEPIRERMTPAESQDSVDNRDQLHKRAKKLIIEMLKQR